MRILVTNDDGIDSVGLHVLARAMKAVGDVVVVAPDDEYSGYGAALGPLHMLEPEVHRTSIIDGIDESWTVSGSPALCVMFARLGMFGSYDLVVAGINPGANVGRSVYHSGTVGAFDYARALERTESFFWGFTDDYLELVKARAYGERGPAAAASARRALREALAVLQQLFAPFLPFVAEEVWRWWHGSSVHVSPWPDPDRLRDLAAGAGPTPSAVASAVLGEVRRAKSEARRPLRTPVVRAVVTDTGDRLAVLGEVADDVRAAGRIGELATAAGSAFGVESELEQPDPAD